MNNIIIIIVGIVIAILLIAVIVLLLKKSKPQETDSGEINRLNGIISEKEKQIDNLNNDYKSLREENSRLNQSNGQYSETEKNYQDLKEKYTVLENEKNNLKEENIKYEQLLNNQKDYETLKQELSSNKEQLQNLKIELSTEKEKNSSLEEKYNTCKEEVSNTKKDYETLKQELSQNKEQIQNLKIELSAEKEKNSSLEEKYKSYKEEFEQLQNNFKNEIIKITNEIVVNKSEEFNKVNKDSLKLILEPFEKEINAFKTSSKENLDEILKPFKIQIDNFQKEIKENTTAQTKNEATFKNHIENMVKETNKISKEADNLINALKGTNRNNKNIGTWGENTLENILIYSGLHKGINYETQESFTITDQEGVVKKQIPDFLVYLPTDKGNNLECIVIDSKVSIEAYINYCSAQTIEEKNIALQSHIDSIRRHIKGLSPKNYEKLPKVKNIDYIMMFIPIEPAYILAMDNAPELWREAYEKKIILMSPTNIIASLKLISLLWNINDRNINAEKIGKLGKDIYEKLASFVEKFNKIGERLDSAKTVFDEAKKTLANERQGLIRKAEGFKEFGIVPKRDIPLIENEEDEILNIEE